MTFVPFPTALLAEYLLHPEAKVAASIYTGTFLAISLAFALLWRHASIGLLARNATVTKEDQAEKITQQYRFGPTLYLLTFGVSFVSEFGSIILCFMLALFFALRDWPGRK